MYEKDEERELQMMRGKKVRVFSFVFVLLSVSISLTFASIHTSHAAGLTITEYHVPSGLDPWGTAFDKNGNVWVAVPGCNPNPDCGNNTAPGKIEVFNPSASPAQWAQTIQLPVGQALFLAFDSSWNLWFPLFHTNQLGEYNPTTGAFQFWTMPTTASGPWDVVFDQNGKLWITEHFVNKVAEFDPITSTFTEYATAATSSQPYGITVDSANDIWFTENNSSVAKIGEVTATGAVQEYPIRTTSNSSLTPHLITVDPATQNIWWTEGFVGEIGELVVANAHPGTNSGVIEYAYPQTCKGCGTHTSGISIDRNGYVWFDDSLQNTIGSFSATGTGTFSMYTVPTSRSHPHDGLRVDSSNRVWFDEEYGEKLAVAVQS